MPHERLFSLIVMVLMAASVCPAIELGPVVGTHSLSSYPIQWIWGEELLTQHADLVGAQVEQEFGNVVAGLRAGLIWSYAHSIWADDDPVNQYRTGLLGGDLRASAALRRPLISEKLFAQAGLALAFDYYSVWSWGEKNMNSAALTQSLGVGLRWEVCGRTSVGLDMDLNLAREGFTHYFFSDTGPSPFWVYRVGTMSPSVVLSALFPLGSR